MRYVLFLIAFQVMSGAVTYDINFTPDDADYDPVSFQVTSEEYLTPGVWYVDTPVPLPFSDGQTTELTRLIVRQFSTEFEFCFGNNNWLDQWGTVRQELGSAVLGAAFAGLLPTGPAEGLTAYGGASWLIEGQGGIGTSGSFAMSVGGEPAPQAFRLSFLNEAAPVATPEPSTLWVSGFALIGLSRWHRLYRKGA